MLHYRFRESFVRHEWFEPSEALHALIADVVRNGALPSDDTPRAVVRSWRAKNYYARRGGQRTEEQLRAQTRNASLTLSVRAAWRRQQRGQP
jgi:hypothetical protein